MNDKYIDFSKVQDDEPVKHKSIEAIIPIFTREDPIRATLNERGKKYGAFSGHASISQSLQNVLKQSKKYESMLPFHKEALSMICHKIGRIMNGDESYDDNYRDIAGYAQLVVDILNENNK